jgi:predicted DNA-binding transcriptional regulator YafY
MNPTKPEAIWRRIIPHAFGTTACTGTRAYCHMERKFKDFIVSRCRETQKPDGPGARAADDKSWQTFFELILRPNPDLTSTQQQTIALDYQMTKEWAAIPIRCALLYYFEKRLWLDIDSNRNKPAEKPVVVENWTEFVHVGRG